MKPRGPEAAKTALIEAAADLFATEGDVSVRRIAERANVNHGLVHHYFDGKPGLRAAVLQHLAEAQAADLEDVDEDDPIATIVAALGAAKRHDRYLKILARMLLDGDKQIVQQSYPVVRRVVRAMEKAGVEDAQARVAEGLAASFGWMVFEPWIRSATGLSKKRAAGLLETALLKPIEGA